MSKYFQAPWTIKNVLIIVSIVVGLFIAAQFGLKYSSITVVGSFLLQYVIFLVPVLILTKFSHLGFDKFKSKHILSALHGCLILIGTVFILSSIILIWGVKIPGYQIQAPIIPIFGMTTLSLTIAAIFVTFVTPVIEEIFFRGFILQGVVNTTDKWTGGILTALIFATFHMQFSSFTPLFIHGLILSYLFIRTKSIWPGIIYHILNNAVIFTIQLLLIKDIIKLDF